MSKFDDQLKRLLNSGDIEKAIDSIPEEEPEDLIHEELLPVVFEEKDTSVEPYQEGSDLYDDYKFARSNYYGLIGRSNAAIDLILRIAAMSEHPRAVEVAANLMKTSADITKELMALQKALDESKGKGKGGEHPPKGTYVQNNHYYTKEEANRIEDELDSFDDNDETQE